jgi:hypothetical protein
MRDYAQQQFCNWLADERAFGSKSLFDSSYQPEFIKSALVVFSSSINLISFCIGRRTTEVQPIAKLMDVVRHV